MERTALTPSRPAPLVFSPVPGGILQRKCACGLHTGGGECKECRKKKVGSASGGFLQRVAVNRGPAGEVPPIVHEVLRSPGQPLDPATRAFFELRFGHDFSQVRVHTDGPAAESARAVNALAYTVGRDMVFGVGQYAPGTGGGRHLLAHELTHVVQQSGGVRSAKVIAIGDPHDRYEQEAAQVGAGALSYGRVAALRTVGGSCLQRSIFDGFGCTRLPDPTTGIPACVSVPGSSGCEGRGGSCHERGPGGVLGCWCELPGPPAPLLVPSGPPPPLRPPVVPPPAPPAPAPAPAPAQALSWTHVLTHENDALWFFCGEHPTGFSITARLRAAGFTNPALLSWAIIAGGDKIAFQGAPTGAEVTVKSTAGSTRPDDVAIRASEGGGAAPRTYTGRMSVRKPRRLISSLFGVIGDRDTPWNGGFKSLISYRMVDNLGGSIKGGTMNEQFGAKTDTMANNWPVPGLQAATDTDLDGVVTDVIGIRGASRVPAPQNPGPSRTPPVPLSGTHVDSIKQEFRIGSLTAGKGCPVQTDDFVRYLDHGRHENIVSPAP